RCYCVSVLTSYVSSLSLHDALPIFSGIGGALTWITIAFAQYRFRKQYVRAGGKVKDLKYAVPFFPLVPIACIVINIIVFIYMSLDRKSTRLNSSHVSISYADSCLNK